jgi:hypothetical protein
VLAEFSQKEKDNRKVIYIDMRNGYSSITYGVFSVLKRSNNVDLKDLAWKFLKKVKINVDLKDLAWKFLKKALSSKVNISNEIEIDFYPFLDVIKTESDPTTILSGLLDEMTENLPSGKVLTMVIDEANLPLTVDGDTSVSDIKQVKQSLALFTRLTKQENKVNNNFIFLLFPLIYLL